MKYCTFSGYKAHANGHYVDLTLTASNDLPEPNGNDTENIDSLILAGLYNFTATSNNQFLMETSDESVYKVFHDISVESNPGDPIE